MAATTGTTATLQLDSATLARAASMLPLQRLVVSTQTPPAGTPLRKGSTVQVTLIDLNNIPIILLHPDLPSTLQGVTVGDAAKLVDSSPDLKTAVTSPETTVTPTRAAELINATGTSITGKTLTADEASRTFSALKSLSTLRSFRLQ